MLLLLEVDCACFMSFGVGFGVSGFSWAALFELCVVLWVMQLAVWIS